MFNKEEALDLAIKAAKEAGRLLIQKHGQVTDIETKSSFSDLVTEVDRASQNLLTEIIKEKYPDHSVYAEEDSQREKGSIRWVVDPLDGTTNYVHGYPFFCVSIGVEVEEELLVGVIYAPVLNELFTIKKGGSPYLNGEKISVSPREDFSQSLFSTGFPYEQKKVETALDFFNKLARKSRGVRRDGSAGLNLAYVATGRFEGFWEIGLSPWDVAAGSLLIREAGGMVTDIDEEPYSIYDSETIIATNGKIHHQLVNTLTK